jgi:hypothetical protein
MNSNLIRKRETTMEKGVSLNISEAVAEVAGCKAHVAECQKVPVDRGELKLAKAALRSAERELRDWQRGIMPPMAEPAIAMAAAAGR